jgi:lysophospholipase L1-like esterase
MSRGFGGLKYGSAVFPGTSITLGVRTGVTAAQALPVLVGAAKGYVPSINAGIGGNTSTQILARFESDCLAYGPSMISIECGHNDPGASIAVGAVGTAGSYTDNVSQMIVKAHRIGARVTLWVPIFAQDSALNTSIAPYRTAMRSLAATHSCDLFDLYDDIVALDSTTQNSFYQDSPGQHLSAAGLVWATGKVGTGAYANSFLSAVHP